MDDGERTTRRIFCYTVLLFSSSTEEVVRDTSRLKKERTKKTKKAKTFHDDVFLYIDTCTPHYY